MHSASHVLLVFVLSLGLRPAFAAPAEDLASPDPAVAAAAVQALAQTRSPANLDLLLDALSTGLHPQVATAAISAIAAYGEPRTFDALALHCRHRHNDVRRAAVAAVAQSRDKRADDVLLEALEDFAPEVRAEALAAVTRRKIRAAIPALLTLLERNDAGAAEALAAVGDAETARQIAERIGRIPDRALAQALGGLLRRKDFGPNEVRLDVVKTIGKLPGAVALPELELYLAKVPEEHKRPAGREARNLVETRKEKQP